MGAMEHWTWLQYPWELNLSRSRLLSSQCPGNTNIRKYRKVNGRDVGMFALAFCEGGGFEFGQ